MTASNSQTDIARRFHATLVASDWEAMRTLLADNADQTLPGNNTISGTVTGADAVVERARKIAGYGLSFELLHILVSRNNVALSLHNTAQRGEGVLDEYLATMCRIENGKIGSIETYLSGVEGMNSFFI